MRHRLRMLTAPFGLAAALLLPASAGAATAIEQNPVFVAALVAMGDGLPAVAAAKLSNLFADGDLDTPSKVIARPRLVEAYLRSGASDKALAAAATDPDEPGSPRLQFWRAQALATAGQTEAAAALLDTLMAKASLDRSLAADARIAQASLLASLGQGDRARETLEPLIATPPTDDATIRARILAAEIELADGAPAGAAALLAPIKGASAQSAYLAARAHLASGSPEQALAALQAVPQESAHAPRIALVRATALAATGENEAARQTLRTLIASHPTSTLLPMAFAQLDDLGDFNSTATEQQFDNWRTSTSESLATLATFYWALAQGRTGDRAVGIAALEEFVATHGDDPLSQRARLIVGRWLQEDGRTDAALAYLEPLASDPETDLSILREVEFLTATAAFGKGDFVTANAIFTALAAEAAPWENSDAVREAASFNASVSTLKATDATNATDPPTPPLPAADRSLELERGLHAAGRGDPAAATLLGEFVATHPTGADAFRANLALAELALLAFPAKPKSALEHHAAAAAILDDLPPAHGLSGRPAEQLDYLEIWIAEAENDDAMLVRRCTKFLDRWTESPLRDQVHMKLGETYYRKANYPSARIQFELLDTEFPASPYAEPALFFAGKAASLTMSPDSLDPAIALWERVAEKEGPLRLYAREQQALALHRLTKHDEAVQIFENILAADPPPAEPLRLSVTLARGEELFVLAAGDPDKIDDAIAAFEAVINDPTISSEWKMQALFRKGKALEAVGAKDEALAAYYDVIAQIATDRSLAAAPPAANAWFYHSGFAAMRLLEAAENWRGAVSVAERLADAGGPRADEAKDLAERLRLQHFIWE